MCSVAEALAEVARSGLAPKPAAAACYAGLLALLEPIHGATDETASVVLRLVTPALLAVSRPGGGGGAGDACKTTSAAPSKEALAASALAREFVATILRWVAALSQSTRRLPHHTVDVYQHTAVYIINLEG